ncbi:hypothetical protein EUX98_g8701 [Antrodiella citrinella]|uniref:Uncharacterized protein n=1 Tax=Antrodiella citrinella TaxID=2447956 RepID=A0A4S4M673_9APHY|nr:hypothetical protein EUX98_g8701 [Antrodiella citrinella]
MASTTTRTRASRKKAADAAAAAQDPGGAPNNPQLPADMGPPNQPNQPNLTEAGDNYPVPAQTTNENERTTGRDDEGGPTADPHLHPLLWDACHMSGKNGMSLDVIRLVDFSIM